MKVDDSLFFAVKFDGKETIHWVECFVTQINEKGMIIESLDPRVQQENISIEPDGSIHIIPYNSKNKGYEIQFCFLLNDTTLRVFEREE